MKKSVTASEQHLANISIILLVLSCQAHYNRGRQYWPASRRFRRRSRKKR